MEVNEDTHVQPPLHRLGMRANGRNTLTVGVSAVIGDEILGNTADARNVVWKVIRGSLRHRRGGPEDWIVTRKSLDGCCQSR